MVNNQLREAHVTISITEKYTCIDEGKERSTLSSPECFV